MTRGDDLFNARDWRALDDVHNPDMIAFIPGSAEPIYGREAHCAAMQQLVGPVAAQTAGRRAQSTDLTESLSNSLLSSATDDPA